MSQRYSGGFLTASYNGLKVPNAPTIGTATGGDTLASVTFTAPANVGGGAITGFTVISSPSGITGTGASSPVTVSGLTNGTAYTFTVVATNAYGTGPASAASNSVTPAIVQGQQLYEATSGTSSTFTWVAPAGVTSVSVVAVGGGGAGNSSGGSGGGGGLGYKNNYTVIPGNSYTVQAGGWGDPSAGNGKNSFFVSTSVACGFGGLAQGAGGSFAGDGGGSGGNGGAVVASSGAGAGGYAGAGGNFNSGQGGGIAGAGGGGGSGGVTVNNFRVGAGGGGVGMLGQGANGTAGVWGGTAASGGGGGSGGGAGTNADTYVQTAGVGGAYGGGGGSCDGTNGGRGAVGAVRIIWPGTTRAFPSTNTGDL